MAATAKKTPEPLEPGAVVASGVPAVVGDQGTQPTDQRALVELESDSGGVFVNTGFVDLVLLQPAAAVKPGRVIELEYDPGHRDLRRAIPEEIESARDAEAAEQAAALAADTGQEQ